jgi:hypothetical protein
MGANQTGFGSELRFSSSSADVEGDQGMREDRMIHRNEVRFRGAELLLEADRVRRRALWLRACGALAALAGALSQNGQFAAQGGMVLALGLVMLALAGEVRRQSTELSREARRAARRQIAESPAAKRYHGYNPEASRTGRAA